MAETRVRLLIVDDSALYRQMIQNVLRDIEGVEVVGIAKDGAEALRCIETLDPDVLTLDVHMPDIDGIGVLREINRRRLRSKAIMVSSLTSEGAQVTTDALLEGAFDFILKPSGPDAHANRTQLFRELSEKTRAFRLASIGGTRLRSTSDTSEAPRANRAVAGAERRASACRAVAIATSTGGPAALKTVLPEVSSSLPVPVFVVQHMPAEYTQSLARRLNELCDLEVVEPTSGQLVRPGGVFIAPGGRQMKLIGKAEKAIIRITDDPAENGCRPAADYLFRSIAKVYGGQVLGVVMTGMGRDGVQGCSVFKESGGTVFAQHERGCLVYGMPKAAIEEDVVDRVLPLERIAAAINLHVEQSRVQREAMP